MMTRSLLSLLLVVTPAIAAAQTPAPRPITLADAIARGRSNGIQGAEARLAASGVAAHHDEIGAALLPKVNGGLSVDRETVNLHEFGISFPGIPAVTDPFTLFRAKASASQVIFDRATVMQLREAKDTAIAAGLDAQRVGEIGAAAAGAAWLRLAAAQETIQARSDDSVTAFALLEVARAQVSAGTSPRIDQTRTETEAAATRTSLAVARNERDRAMLDLSRTLDLPTDTPVLASGDPVVSMDSVPTDAAAAVALARAHRSDLAAEKQRQAVLNEGLAAIRSEFIPTVAAAGYLQTSGTATDQLARSWDVGVSLNWPILDGFRRQRRVDEQRIRIDAETLRLHDLDAQVEADAREAVLDIASARDQVALATERVRLAEEVLSEARDRFSAGVAGSVETTNAQAELATARDVLIQARVSAAAAQVGAAKALGLLDQVH
ncbi:MAG TPA: TolC family protein [Gemmatimonadales bacterium]|jgi:outer membrane protein TolC|nr:TolC family protein [Gemmatimonadales bacterium]